MKVERISGIEVPEDWPRTNGSSAGDIGCTLSHLHLIKKLKHDGLNCALVMEDDVIIADGFDSYIISMVAPPDWDMIWLRMWKPIGTDVAPGIIKLQSDPRVRVNLGTFAYVVRHGAIQNKILPALKYMNDAFDEQINNHFNEWNCYVLHPGIIDINDELQAESAINAINVAPEETKV
jgi:GR25 family glycosyltransferase involved in LPS biosynthesis